MPLQAVADELAHRHGPKLSIAIGVDGSDMSTAALHVACALTCPQRKDKTQVFHVSDASKTYLSKHLTPSHLRNFYLDLAATKHVKADWVCREKEPGESTCETLTKLADKDGVDLLVLGSFGRKGEKLDVLGTVSDYSLREAHCSICIVRPTSTKWEKGCKYLFATDGSHAASLAFCVLLHYLRKAGDTVNVVMVTSTDGQEDEKVLNDYRTYMKKHQIVGDCQVKCIDINKSSVPEGILEAASEKNADVLVVGISGYGKKKLGSVSEEISQKATCTTIMIKDSLDVDTKRYESAGAVAQEVHHHRSSLEIVRNHA